MTTRLILAVMVIVSLLLSASGLQSAFAAPITFNTALPVAQGEGIFRIQAKYTQATDDPGSDDRELQVFALPTVGVYGATEKLTLFAVAPYLDKELELGTSQGRRTRGVSGLGDVRLMARYTAWRMDLQGETLRGLIQPLAWSKKLLPGSAAVAALHATTLP